MPKNRVGLFFMVTCVVAALSVAVARPDIAAAETSNKRTLAAQIQTLKKKATQSQGAIRFWESPSRGRWMLALRHEKCWEVQGHQRRKVCRLARQMYRFHKHRLAKLETKIEKLTGPQWCDGLTGNRAIGCKMAYRIWPSEYEWNSLDTLWHKESKWDQYARNPSGACGIPQAMNSCSFGYDPVVQIRWGLSYILHRDGYGSPSRALSAFYSRSPHWY